MPTGGFASPGVSVWMWGPPCWRLLFALAWMCDAAVLARASNSPFLVKHTLGCLRAVMATLPCSLCRASCKAFLACVQDKLGMSLDTAIQRGECLRFLYTLRNCVNDKLQRQALENAGVGVSESAPPPPSNHISFTNLQRRMQLGLQHVTAEDVVTYLNALRLNHEPAFGAQYEALVQHLAPLLQQLATDAHGPPPANTRQAVAPSTPPLHALAFVLRRWCRRVGGQHPSPLASRQGFTLFASLIVLWMAPRHRSTARRHKESRQQHAARLLKRYDVMQAFVRCGRGTCSAA